MKKNRWVHNFFLRLVVHEQVIVILIIITLQFTELSYRHVTLNIFIIYYGFPIYLNKIIDTCHEELKIILTLIPCLAQSRIYSNQVGLQHWSCYITERL